MATDPDFYATVDSSIYKSLLDKDGEEENSVVIAPRIHHNNGHYEGTQINIDTYDWRIIKINSNFKNAVNYQSFAEVVPLTPTNQKNVAFKVKNIQDGEVVFIQIACFIEDQGNVGALDDFDYEFGNGIYSNQVAYKKDPINTKFRIWTTKNGKLIQDLIYDSAIEQTMQFANEARVNFFNKLEQTSNGSRESITEHLIRFEELKNNNADFSSIDTNDVLSVNSSGQYVTKSKKSVAFIKDELAFYAHGRSLDEASIRTLLSQNPSNSITTGPRLKPDFALFVAAHQHRRRQSPGYNSYMYPMLNPAVSPKNSMENDTFFFPGRSGHGGTGGGNQICGDVTADFTWTPPGYPTCPGG